MKFFESLFEDYTNNVKGCNLHPKLNKIYDYFPKQIIDLKNLIIFGPSGTGKYSQSLYIIQKYSPSLLKYEKKANIIFNKEPYFIKISDIHYEVDMSLLGCNSKQLWHELYLLIVDIITTKQNKYGIILCKNFHSIDSELLENFYSYMQRNNNSHVNIKFVLITEEYSFINNNILNCSYRINVSRPPKTQYNKIITYNNEHLWKQNKISKINHETMPCYITNIKSINNNSPSYKKICNKILKSILNIEDLNLMEFRELLYDILIYEINIYNAVWYILDTLINKHNIITQSNISDIIIKTFEFLKYYNNNYRPIFHLENYFLFLCQQISTSNNTFL
jgi:hypothetical protein